MKGITPCLWFDDEAEEAARFYASVFKDSKVGKISRYGEAGAKVSGRPAGSVLTVEFELDGKKFVALNGGPEFRFNEAVSFMVQCENQREIDEYWDKLTRGGSESVCGWLKDRYGVSWQIVPTALAEMLRDEDRAKSEAVMTAMLAMKKIDLRELQRAYEEAGAVVSS
jgi:predicted 3-demethylubiquinone-9 3-methyltransferase (glyoxalase superfamily)